MMVLFSTVKRIVQDKYHHLAVSLLFYYINEVHIWSNRLVHNFKE